MFQLSDSDSVDSDEGIRFKTENVRNKHDNRETRKLGRVSLSNEDRNRRRDQKNRDSSRSSRHSSSSRSSSHRDRRPSKSEEERRQRGKHSKLDDKNKSSYVEKIKNRYLSKQTEINKPSKIIEKRYSNDSSDKAPRGSRSPIDTLPAASTSLKLESVVKDDSKGGTILGPTLPEKPKSDIINKPEVVDACPAVGPVLPPHMLRHQCSGDEKFTTSGPILPPDLQSQVQQNFCELTSQLPKKISEESKEISQQESPPRVGLLNCDRLEDQKCVIGPTLPPHLHRKSDTAPKQEPKPVIGPELPNSLQIGSHSLSENTSTDLIGPALPNNVQKPRNKTTLIIGPALPPHLQASSLESSTNINTDISEVIENVGEESEDEEMYGPLPPGMIGKTESHIALEERALQLKLEQLEPSQTDATVREEWMLELPENKASNLGLGPRQFKTKIGPDLTDRSCWTDTPSDKKKKKMKEKDKGDELRRIAKQKELESKDALQEAIVKKHKNKYKESLLETHQKKIKKQKADEGPSERRPFSRELDLQVNRFDEAQKKSVLKKAQLLDDRFMTEITLLPPAQILLKKDNSVSLKIEDD